MIVKLQQSPDKKTVVAACDSDLIGKKFEEDNRQLDLTVDFYKGKETDDREAGDLIRNADSVNLVGEKAVALGVKEGIIEPQQVKKIKGIPYAQAVVEHG